MSAPVHLPIIIGVVLKWLGVAPCKLVIFACNFSINFWKTRTIKNLIIDNHLTSLVRYHPRYYYAQFNNIWCSCSDFFIHMLRHLINCRVIVYLKCRKKYLCCTGGQWSIPCWLVWGHQPVRYPCEARHNHAEGYPACPSYPWRAGLDTASLIDACQQQAALTV